MIGSILLWLLWTALILVSGFFTVLMLAFASDAPQNRRKAQWLVNVGIFGWLAAAWVGFALLSHRDSVWDIAGAMLSGLGPPLVCWGAIWLLFRARD